MATKKIVSVEQRFELLAKLGGKVDWDLFDSDSIQQIIDQPSPAGQQFTLFLQNGARINLGEMKITPAPFDPAKFLGKDWKVIAEEHDARNDDLTEVDFSDVDFVKCLNEGETSITGEEKFMRLKESGRIRYGLALFMGLWLDSQAKKENSVLETLFRTKGITYMDFFGDVLLDPYGSRDVLCFCRLGDGRWHWYCDWLGDGWGARRRSAVSSQVSARDLVNLS